MEDLISLLATVRTLNEIIKHKMYTNKNTLKTNNSQDMPQNEIMHRTSKLISID